MTTKFLFHIFLLTFILLPPHSVWATTLYRQGCEFPMQGVEVCWEATGEEDAPISPYPQVHLLPIAREMAGQEEILTDYTRAVYQQLLPGNFSEHLVWENRPAFYIEQAIKLAQYERWPILLWISPRTLRNSSAMSSGLVDLDVQLIKGGQGKLLRSMRIRVASKPQNKKWDVEAAAASGGLMILTGAALSSPLPAAAVVATSAANADTDPPVPGLSLDLLTQLAVRQIIFLSQYSMEDLQTPGSANPPPPSQPLIERSKGWINRIFAGS
ncbi:MAG: hypothetical protein H7832_08915 [Magnetococcus sp. DMHC-6]